MIKKSLKFIWPLLILLPTLQGCEQIEKFSDKITQNAEKIENKIDKILNNKGGGVTCSFPDTIDNILCLVVAIAPGNPVAGPGPGPGNPPGGGGQPAPPVPPPPAGAEGSDLLSTTTNFSEKIEDPETKARGISGAAYIPPPQPNNYGAVDFSYPIEVPPGRAGVQPQLAISYSSNGGDGLIGMGWSIGMGSISRSTRYGQLYYDSRDTFTYNGKRLIKVSGSTTNENGVYRLEIESDFLRLELSNIEDGGTWLVYGSDGSITSYGDGLDSRIYDPTDSTRTFTWHFSRTSDRNGNSMHVDYDISDYASNRMLYIGEIHYTGNVNLGTSGEQVVRFFYKKRNDAYVSKGSGFTMKLDRLLDRIEVGLKGDTLWEYQLVYTTSPDSGRPLLKTVNSSRTTTSPEFFYQQGTNALAWQKIFNPSASDPTLVDPTTIEYFEGDFNGDGISDMVFFNPLTGFWKAAEGRSTGGYNHKIYANRFKDYVGPDKIQWFKGNVSGDYNGDGRSDIAFYLPETKEFWVAEHDGQVFQFRMYGALYLDNIDIFKAEWFPGDYDGNGLSDSVLFDEATGEWTLMRNTGGQFEFIKFSKHFQNLFRNDYSPNFNMDSVSTNDKSAEGKDRSKIHFLNGDYNGDGRTDISIYDERDGKWWVAENYIDDVIGFRLEWKLYKVFTAPEQTLFGHDRFSGDFNGDGTSDFMLFNRATDEWIIGETLNGTINFRIFSTLPEHRTITRWLQGDFNGDGRTDIGYYSADDQNFWIGEATATGFRYRIYSNMFYGPDPDKIMKTPAPEEEVVLKDELVTISNLSDATIELSYKYDGNSNNFSGEQVFAGCFTLNNDCKQSPELLIYNRFNKTFQLKTGSAPPLDQNDIILDLESPDIKLINNGRPGRYTDARDSDEILYYKKTESSGIVYHNFYVIYVDASQTLQQEQFAAFTSTEVENFSIDESLYLIGDFNGAARGGLLVLNDEVATANFLHSYNNVSITNTSITINSPDIEFKNIFKSGTGDANRNFRSLYSFFAAKLSGSGTELLMVDRSVTNHSWYRGAISSGQITFSQLSEAGGNLSMELQSSDYDSEYGDAGLFYYTRPIPLQPDSEQLVYATTVNDTLYIHTISSDGAQVTQNSYSVGAGLNYKNEYDHNYKPIVYQDNTPKLYDFTQQKLTQIDFINNAEYKQVKLERPDLYIQAYPYRWIQGDYNGDNKTDIGIFHIKEATWYFANSTGDAPDIINKINNGIGGTYRFEYISSTTLDNTGADSIPDLPMNFRLCSRIIKEDGLGNSISTWYEYSGGYAFSAFINGYKETDYFGFSRFVIRDGYGGKSINEYYTTPYNDFRQNRALAGAIKSNTYIGHDNQKYTETHYNYQLHEINQGGAQSQSSFLVNPARVDKYVKEIMTETREREVTIVPGAYELLSITESVTDHYSDTAHPSETIANYTRFETVAATNQQRPVEKRNFDGLAHETTTTYEYDAFGNTSRETTAYSGAGLPAVAPRIREFSYDGYGNLTLESDSSGTPARVVERDYDTVLNQFVVTERQLTDTGALTTAYTINYAEAFGQPDIITDPNGNNTYNDYDSYGRLVVLRADTESGIETLQNYSYSNVFPLSARSDFNTGTTAPTVQFRTYVDGLGRDIHTVRSATNGRYVRTGRQVYDGLGRVVRKSQTDWATAGEIDSFKLNLNERHPTLYEYDGSGRTRKVTMPVSEGETTETSITTIYNDPWEVTTIHSGGKSKRTISNARGHVLYVEDSGIGDDGSLVKAKIGFCYDVMGNRVKKSDLNGGAALSCPTLAATVPARDTSGNNIATWSYDAFGQLRQASDPDLGVSSYGYNEFGDRTSITDALNRTTTMQFDRLGRMIMKLLPGTDGTVLYTYDTYPGSSNSQGRLVVVNEPVQSKVISYDKLGRIASETRTIINHSTAKTDVPYTTTYRYDLMNRNHEIDYPADPTSGIGSRVCYSYNEMGYTDSIEYRSDATAGAGCASERVIIAHTDYNEFGQVANIAYGNGVATDYTYDIRGRISRIVSVHTDGSISTTIQDASYTFDVDNSIKSVTNNSADYQTSYNYNYDGFNRLVAANGNYATAAGVTLNQFQRSYSYADNGNLLGKKFHDPNSGAEFDSWSYSYDNHMATNIASSLDGAGRFNMSYDAMGNMVQQSDGKLNLTKNMEYDSYNRIRRVLNSNGNEVARYEYDDQGFRIRKITSMQGGSETLYTSKFFGMDVAGQISTVNNIYHNGLRIAAVSGAGHGYFFMTDQVDSVHLVLGADGSEVSRMEYMPYGETFVQEGNTDFKPKYNSQELDEETNYYFYNARHYDPQISRFVTADTVIDGEYDTQGWNRFMYVKGNPIIGKDPTGHFFVEAFNELKNFLFGKDSSGSSSSSTPTQSSTTAGTPSSSTSANQGALKLSSKTTLAKGYYLTPLSIKSEIAQNINTSILMEKHKPNRNTYCNQALMEAGKLSNVNIESLMNKDVRGKPTTNTLLNEMVVNALNAAERPEETGVYEITSEEDAFKLAQMGLFVAAMQYNPDMKQDGETGEWKQGSGHGGVVFPMPGEYDPRVKGGLMIGQAGRENKIVRGGNMNKSRPVLYFLLTPK